MHGMSLEQMKVELKEAGVKELKTQDEVSDYFSTPKTCLLVFNSVCGCAAASARPGIVKALSQREVEAVSVFAGIDRDATQRARDLFSNYDPSSPSALLIVDGEAVYQLAREDVLGYTPAEVTQQLLNAFEEHMDA